MARICLITSHHVSFQPRALREADSLQDAGHSVRVVCRQVDPVLTDHDRKMMQSRKWRLQSVPLQRNGANHNHWLIESIRVKAYRHLFEAGLRTAKVANRAYVKGYDRLLSLTLAESADWYIAHTQSALPIAAAAAQRWNAKLGFDCEDLLAENGTDPPDIVSLIQQRYVPLCDYVSVPSQSVGSRLAEAYSIRTPLVLYNVSPLHLADGLLCPQQRPARPGLRLHWVGQTVGAGRGIEEAIEALGMLENEQVELHLRGRLDSQFRSTIEALARRYHVVNRIVFHPPVDPQDVVRAMDQFDVGLALERPDHGNYSLAATNKLLSYILAGLAVAATDTPGHRELLEQIPAVGFLHPASRPERLVEGLRRWISERDLLRQAQQAAWQAARERFCWDIEKQKFLTMLN